MGGIGSSAKEGFVEGRGTDGKWGGICQKDFDIDDAHVICRMVGFPSATAALANGTAAALYGTLKKKKFVLSRLGCTGHENSIFDCPHKGEWNENCDATEIAGVICGEEIETTTVDLETTTDPVSKVYCNHCIEH